MDGLVFALLLTGFGAAIALLLRLDEEHIKDQGAKDRARIARDTIHRWERDRDNA